MKRVSSSIIAVSGSVVTLRAEGASYGELATIYSAYGQSLAEVIRLYRDEVTLQVFNGGSGISTKDRVVFHGHTLQISFSDALLGRVFNGAGVPLDNGPQLSDQLVEIGGPSINPIMRIIPRNMIRTGIPMIDVFNTLVESQKLPIFSISGEPYNHLLARIAMQAEVDIIILATIGITHDDYLFFRDRLD